MEDTIFLVGKIGKIFLGYKGENNTRKIQIDVSEWVTEYPQGNIRILHSRPTETAPYIVANTSIQNGILTWNVGNGDVGINGQGNAVITLVEGEKVLKTSVFTTVISDTLNGTVQPAPPVATPNWVTDILNSRIESFTISNGHLFVTKVDGIIKDLGEVKGQKGDKGDTGETGATGPQGPQGPQGPAGSDATVNATNVRNAGGLIEPSSGLEVGKTFRIASIDENGHAVLECVDAPSDGATKLKIAGTVQTPDSDGYVNVPVATNDIYGLSKTLSTHGIVTQAGYLVLVRATNTNIDGRKTRAIIDPTNFDYAVKVAMTDGIGATWTDAEKTNARTRIGAINAQTILLGEVTTTEDVSAAAIDYANGNLLTEFDKLILLVTFPVGGVPADFTRPTVVMKSIYGSYSATLFSPMGSTKINITNIHTAFTFEIIRKPTADNLDVSVINTMVSNYNQYSPVVNSVVSGVARFNDTIDNWGFVKFGKGIQFSSGGGVNIPSGTKIELFGVKY